VAGHYLRKGEVVVSIADAHPPRSRTWRAAALPVRIIPIVVAGESLLGFGGGNRAGACRITTAAWILGETTFGKGLVQTVYPLEDNTGLALTTAHYYTPSGRLIQRDYSNISFLDYYYGKRTETKNLQDVKSTDSGANGVRRRRHHARREVRAAQVQQVPDRSADQVRVLQFHGEMVRFASAGAFNCPRAGSRMPAWSTSFTNTC
jgi:hypothetical protein